MRVKSILRNTFIANTLIMIFGSNFVNFLNYLYHLIIGRMLGPSSYGELAGLLSFIGLLGIIPGSMTLVINKSVSSADEKEELDSLVEWVSKTGFIVGIFLLALTLSLSKIINNFFNFSSIWLVVVLSISFIFSVATAFNRAILQGRLLFKEFLFTALSENLFKLIVSILFIYLGWQLFGAILGTTIACVFGWIVTRNFIKNQVSEKSVINPINKRQIFAFAVPVLIQSLALTSLYSSDVLLVKHFFTSFEAGIYASLSTLSKIVFFATGPVAGVMFPMISQRKTKGEEYFSIFFNALVITVLISLGVLFIYTLIPSLVVDILYGSAFSLATNYLFLISLTISFFTVSSLCISFCLSINRIKIIILPLIAAIFQIIGIIMYHQTLNTVILVSLIINISLCLSSLCYILKIYYEKK